MTMTTGALAPEVTMTRHEWRWSIGVATRYGQVMARRTSHTPWPHIPALVIDLDRGTVYAAPRPGEERRVLCSTCFRDAGSCATTGGVPPCEEGTGQ
jgi:hypothetical protein